MGLMTVRSLTYLLLLAGSMNVRSLLAFSLLLVPVVLGAQEVVTLNQGLVMVLDASQAGGGGSSDRALGMQADYRFDVGMPILTYRLGTLNLGGNLDWTWQSVYGEQASALNLNSIGVAGSLFPYQPYQFSFDYTHNTSPNLFGGGKSSSDNLGLGISYQGRLLQHLRMDYRRGTTSGFAQGDFSSYSIQEDQHLGSTDLQFQGDRLEYTSAGITWRYTNLFASAYSPLSRDWLLMNHMRFMTNQDSRQTQFGSLLMGKPGDWTSVTSLDAGQDAFSLQTSRRLGLNQSLARTWGRMSGFTMAGVATASQSGESSASHATHLTLGGVYKLTQAWSLVGDVSGAWAGQANGPGESANPSMQARAFHVGLTWGGKLPDQLRHLLFYWNNLQFQRRLAEDYPPDYLPQEMTQMLVQRRREQDGPLAFSTDLYRNDNDLGHQLWYRMNGTLSLGMGLMVQIMGDLRRDVGFSDPKGQATDQNINLYGTQRLGRGSLSFSYGHYRSDQSILSTSSRDSGSGVPFASSASSTSYSLGWNTFVTNIPVGTYLLRGIDARGLVTSRLAAFTDASIGKLRFRILYQHGWRSDGTRGDQLSINLLRTFDTIALWGLGN